MQPLSSSERFRQLSLLVFSILAMLGLLGYGGYNLTTSIRSFDPADPASLAPGALGTLSMLVCAVLLMPMLIHSLRRLNRKEIQPWAIPPVKFWQLLPLFVVWMGCVVIAGIVNSLHDFGWAFASPFYLAGMLLPVILLVWVAAGGLTGGSPRRLWAVFGTSMGGSTVLAVLGEYLVIGAFAVLLGVIAYANPEVKSMIDQVRSQLEGGMDAETMLTTLAPYLTNPLLYAALLVLVAGIGPLIEEAVKPAVLWLIGKNLRSPAEGFALGALCGAGFALLEGMIATSGTASMLGYGLAARFASTLMHITASGLVGWGIASARLQKRYGRMASAYLLACTLHGLWNGSVLTTIYGTLRLTLSGLDFEPISLLTILAGLGLLGMTFISILVLLPLINWRLRVSLPVPSAGANDIIAPLASQLERNPDGLDSKIN